MERRTGARANSALVGWVARSPTPSDKGLPDERRAGGLRVGDHFAAVAGEESVQDVVARRLREETDRAVREAGVRAVGVMPDQRRERLLQGVGEVGRPGPGDGVLVVRLDDEDRGRGPIRNLVELDPLAAGEDRGV